MVIWTDDKLIDEAGKYFTRSEFKKGSPSAYQTAWKRGILDYVCSHMRDMSSGPRKWTFENLVSEAKKYDSKWEFRLFSRGAYDAAGDLGILKDITSHMNFVSWDERPKEEVKAEALKYRNRTEFNRGSNLAWRTAKENGWLDEFYGAGWLRK